MCDNTFGFPVDLTLHVDRVSWQERQYAYKQCTKDAEDMLLELGILSQFSSPRLQQLASLVIDNQRRLRGFLTPFMTYGSIEEVFVNLAHPDPREMEELGNTAYWERPSWTTKLKWAKQLTRGIIDLHSSSLGPILLQSP